MNVSCSNNELETIKITHPNIYKIWLFSSYSKYKTPQEIKSMINICKDIPDLTIFNILSIYCISLANAPLKHNANI